MEDISNLLIKGFVQVKSNEYYSTTKDFRVIDRGNKIECIVHNGKVSFEIDCLDDLFITLLHWT